jgi:hypothetical protein
VTIILSVIKKYCLSKLLSNYIFFKTSVNRIYDRKVVLIFPFLKLVSDRFGSVSDRFNEVLATSHLADDFQNKCLIF